MSRNNVFVLAALMGVLSLVCLGPGCGKKQWPEPNLDKDRFVWSEMSTHMRDRCLEITALLSGNVQNLAGLTLEVEMRSDPCPGCPFSPTHTVRMDASSKSWERRGALVNVVWCGLEPDKAVRWRLIGHPIHPSMNNVPSRVYNLEREEDRNGASQELKDEEMKQPGEVSDSAEKETKD